MAQTYETNLMNLIERFGSDDQCREYLEAPRWPNGVACIRCGNTSVSRLRKRDQYECNAESCGYRFSVTSGTIMHDSHLPLRKWFIAIYLIIEGSPEGTNVKYDRKGALLNIREQMKEEKMEIKEILNEEFGLFKKDSASFNETEEHRSPGFILEWEEEEIEKSDSLRKVTLKRDNKPGQEKFIIRWEDEEETDTVDFEKGKQRRLIKRK